MPFKQVVLCVVAFAVTQVSGNGRLYDPPGRSSMWRFGFQTQPNYDDMSINCGGKEVQYHKNGGKCGICGDNYADPTPRDNEDQGKYGKGIVVSTYVSGGQLPVFVQLTKEHLGYFDFQLCALNEDVAESEECFEAINLVNGEEHYPITGFGSYINHTMSLQLPEDVTCERCVLRWHYRTGNSHGTCEDGTLGLGCGNQENFVNCADIAIE